MYSQNKLSLSCLQEAYSRGENIIELLESSNAGFERSEIIEFAYDLQSGSYIKDSIDHPARLNAYAHQIYSYCSSFINSDDVILDCGTGELTTLSALSHYLPERSKLLAFDISLSRLRLGFRFASSFMRSDLFGNLNLFVADMARIPLASHSVDVVITVHSLEPNFGREGELIRELLRVAKRQLILFEPSWERSNSIIRSRMEKHGYIRNLPHHIKEAGGVVVSIDKLSNPVNPLNPTYCYIVQPAEGVSSLDSSQSGFICPRSFHQLNHFNGYWWSTEGGWAYPIIEGISCLRIKHSLLMSHA